MISVKTKRPVPIHKNSGLIHLPALAGEDVHKLNHLMHDTRSEFSKNIRTYNTAVNTNMNRYLSQSLRDVHSTIDNLNRSQQATYKTMCKIISIQKKRAKETYQQYQQSLREDNPKSLKQDANQVRRKAVHGFKLPEIEQEATEPANPELEINSIQLNRDIDAIESVRESQEQTIPDIIPANSQGQIIQENIPIAAHSQLSDEASKSQPSSEESSALHETESKKDTEPEPTISVTVKSKPSEATSPPKCAHNNLTVTNEESQSATISDKLSEFTTGRGVNKKAFFTASLRPTLPPITETGDAAGKGKANLQVNEKLDGFTGYGKLSHHPGGSVYAGSTMTMRSSRDVHSPSGSVDETVISAQRATSLRARIADLEQQHMKEFLRKQNLETKIKPYELGVDMDEALKEIEHREDESDKEIKPAVNRSIAAERRKLAKLRVAHRKAVLNSENNYQYVQLSDGSFKKVSTYKKKRFLPPSNREEYERKLIIKSEAARTEMNGERIGNFFQKLDLPLPSEIRKKAIKRRESKSVLDPAAAASAEAADPIEAAPVPVKREKSRVIKPLSEVAKTVAYIRQYIRPSDREDDQTLRNTSWSQHN